MLLKIKICGITNMPDAEAAVQAGADALGFMFYASSPRHITPDQASKIIRRLPPFVAKVGVFVNAPTPSVLDIARHCGLDTLQFHGDESPEECADPSLAACKCLKAFRMRDHSTLRELAPFAEKVDAFLLDSYTPNQRGGTGARFNWDLAVEARSAGRPVILAGGLTPDNIAEAVAKVRPYGVDVSSGVEVRPGLKDSAKMENFVREARRAAGRPAS